MSILFNPTFYLQNNPDVLQAVAAGTIPSAEFHYNNFGFKEGRDPNATFDTSFYLVQYPDVLAAGVNPLQHFIQFGAIEGRVPNADFVTEAQLDGAAYLAANPDVQAAVTAGQFVDAYHHFAIFGFAEGRPGSVTVGGVEIIDGVPATPAVGETFVLTTGSDTSPDFDGTNGADTYTGSFGAAGETLTGGDSLDGKLGEDALNLTAIGTGTSAPAEIQNIENVVVKDAFGSTVSAVLFQDDPTIRFTNTLDGQTSSVINTSLGSTHGLSGKGDLKVDFLDTSGTADTAKVLLADAGTDATNRSTIDVADGNTIEGVDIDASGKNFLTLNAGTAAKTVTITGAGANTIGIGSIATTSTINAAAATGAQAFILGSTLTNGDTIKGGSGDDSASATIGIATQATLESVDTLDLKLGSTFDLKNTTGTTAIKMDQTANASLINAGADLTSLTTTASSPAGNDFFFSARSGVLSTLDWTVGGKADIAFDDVTFRRTEDLTINVTGTKQNDINDLFLEDNGVDSSLKSFTVNVGADGDLDLANVSAGDSGGPLNNLDVTLDVGEDANLDISSFDATDFGNFKVTVGNDATFSGDFYSSGGNESGAPSADIGDVAMSVATSGSGDLYASAGGGGVGDVTLDVIGDDASGWLSVSGSAVSAADGDSEGSDASIGNITLNVDGSGASGYVSGYASGGDIGDINVTINGDASGYVSGNADEWFGTGPGASGNIGNTVATVGDDGYFDLDLNASGSVGSTTVSGGDDVDVYNYVTGYSGSVGAVDVMLGDSSYYSGYFSANSGSVGDVSIVNGDDDDTNISVYASGTVGDVTATIGEDANFSGRFSGDDGIGDVSVTVGQDSDVTMLDLDADTTTGTVGLVTLTGATGATFNVDVDANALIGINAAGAVGNVTANVSGVTTGTTVTTGAGDDTVTGTGAGDVISTGAGKDTITAGGGADTINAGAGDDTVDGGAGADSITGGAGKDSLTGGADADTFIFAAGDSVESAATKADGDTITDFTTASDKIDLPAVGAYKEALETGNGYATVVANANAFFATKAGGADIYAAVDANTTGNTWVLVDTNGNDVYDAGTDTFVILTGVDLLTEIAQGDFV